MHIYIYKCIFICIHIYILAICHRPVGTPRGSHEGHAVFICLTYIIHSYMWCPSLSTAPLAGSIDSSIRATCVIYIYDMTYPYVWLDLSIRLTWLIHTFHMSHSYVRRYWCIFVTWLIPMCDMTRLYMWHDSFRYMSCHPRTYAWHNPLHHRPLIWPLIWPLICVT